MNILVCISHVPDTTSSIAFDAQGTLVKSGLSFVVGPYEDFALSRAVELKTSHSASVTVINVGLAETEPILRKCLAIGADNAIRINAKPLDAFFVAKQIAHIAAKRQDDLILTGRESIDYNGGLVHGMLGNLLNRSAISPIMRLDIQNNIAHMTREIEGGNEQLRAPMPLILGCQEPIADWKIPNMRGIMQARTKPLEVLEPQNIQAQSQNKKTWTTPPRQNIKWFKPEDTNALVKQLIEVDKVI